MTAKTIFANVLAAMQPAEEIGGPEGEEYIDLMTRIAVAALERAKTAQQAHEIKTNGGINYGVLFAELQKRKLLPHSAPLQQGAIDSGTATRT